MSRSAFRDLSTVIDGLHELVDGWAEAGVLAPALDADSVEVLRLALHEWVANLVQHATFPAGAEIVVEMEAGADGVQCAVEDSSLGFDFAKQIEHQQELLDAPAPSERGRGLLMLITCTDDLLFQPAAPGQRQRISFRVRAESLAPRLDTLFRASDLEPEPFAPAPFAPDAHAPHGDSAAGEPVFSSPPAPPASAGPARVPAARR